MPVLSDPILKERMTKCNEQLRFKECTEVFKQDKTTGIHLDVQCKFRVGGVDAVFTTWLKNNLMLYWYCSASCVAALLVRSICSAVLSSC
mmetsp:Transcript_7077/g.15089  ORF Transcript_7077/g.15089 Transcript_7077/m.15089 type:complete len:90 (-) Transcript_7077:972-1241(-)